MKTIVNNLAVNYLDQGEGKTILILHGWWRESSDFENVASYLKENFKVVILDLPGFGGTEIPKDKVWDLDAYVNFVDSFIKKLGLKIYAVVGHSFGGRIVLKNQFGAEKLVLISAAGLKTQQWRKNFLMALAKLGDLVSYIPPLVFIRSKLKKRFYKVIGSDYLDSGNMKEVFKAVIAEDLAPFAEKVDKETLIIWGEKDMVTPLDQARTLNRLIKKSKLEVLEGTGHFSMVDLPEKTADLIEKFLHT